MESVLAAKDPAYCWNASVDCHYNTTVHSPGVFRSEVVSDSVRCRQFGFDIAIIAVRRNVEVNDPAHGRNVSELERVDRM